MTGFNATKRKKSKEKMDEDKFYVKNGIVRRLNDKIPRMEAGCRFGETTEAIILKGTRRVEFPTEICFLLAPWKRCIVRMLLTTIVTLVERTFKIIVHFKIITMSAFRTLKVNIKC